MKNKKGFTLVELVVAIAILGVITLIAIPTINKVQSNNKEAKYVTYEKSLKSASKAFTDAYDEDLFGATNSGCATIKYSELKDRDLVSDLQIKGTKCDKDEDTFIFVMKAKNGNHAYFSNIKCYDSKGIVYSHQEGKRDKCEIEDGTKPKISIIFDPDKPTYYVVDHPKAKIRISDNGIGLKANQKIKYTWYKGTTPISSTNTIEFKNKNYQGSASRYVQIPSTLGVINEPTDYYLKVFTDSSTGKICDVDLNCTDANENSQMHYFVGALLIKMKAGGAKMIDPHGVGYSVVTSNDHIYHIKSGYTISRIKYKSSSDLYNYNYEGGINIRKAEHYIDPQKEWKMGSNVYDQGESLTVGRFGFKDEDLIYKDQEVTVEANWKQQVKITVKATNQSKGYDGTALNADSTCSVTSGSLMSGDRISCSSTGSQTTVGSSTKTLSSVKVLDSAGKDVTYRYIVTKNNGTLTVSCNNVISGTISKGQKVTYGGIEWTVLSADSNTVDLAANSLMGHGSFNNAVANVTASLKDKSSAIKSAIDSGVCATVLGSTSDNTDNISSGPYWLKSGKVHFKSDVNTYDVSSTAYTQGFSGVVSGTNHLDSVTTSLVTSCSSKTLYKAGYTYDVANSASSISYPNSSCISKTTSNRYSRKVTRFHPMKYTTNTNRLYVHYDFKGVTASDFNDGTDIINVRYFRFLLCGGTYNKKYWYMKADDAKHFYGETYPGSGKYEEHSYRHNKKNNKYIFLAGHKPGGSEDCSNYPKVSSHGYCTHNIKDDTSENHGGWGDNTKTLDPHHYYDHYHNGSDKEVKELCIERDYKEVTSSSSYIYYRPTIRVVRG